ncbi:MAG TPA: ribbon-helix-helix protein, CopG family [Pirellulales bacterium]|nr:ribbon-helix-helix protein, CopG family [Pirellulales bacterium]
MEKVSVTCKLNADDVKFLDKLGGMTDRDRSYLIKQAVANFIANQKWQVEEVEQALAEADRGEILTDEQFRREVRSWDK